MTGPSDDAVPLVDLGWQHDQIAGEVADGWAEVLATTAFVGGPQVAAFEEQFARYCGVEHCVGVGNGTDALELALRAADVGPGAECVLPANSFVATAEAVVRAGATPVLVDIDPHTFLLDPDATAAAIEGSDRVAAVIPVHLYGRLADPAPWLAEARARGVVVLEDAAQSQGAVFDDGRGSGSLGDIAATSFYPGKNLGAYGDAGAVLTNAPELAERVRLLGAHGERERYRHEIVGFNSRLDTLQAVVLSAKLRRLDEWNQLRRAAAAHYDELLAGVEEVVTPAISGNAQTGRAQAARVHDGSERAGDAHAGSDPAGDGHAGHSQAAHSQAQRTQAGHAQAGHAHVWHLYVVRVPSRDDVLAGLRAEGIGAAIHYPVPIHLTPAFAHLGYGPGSFPEAERAAREILTLPLFPGITAAQQERVVETLLKVLRPSSSPLTGPADDLRSLRTTSDSTRPTAESRFLVSEREAAADDGVHVHPQGLCESDQVGARTRVWAFAHVLPGARIGSDSNICDGAFVEGGAVLGNGVTVKNGTLIFAGVTCEDDVFLGPNVLFTNDLRPRAFVKRGQDELLDTRVETGATLGAGTVVVCGLTIGAYALCAAGSVVTKDVPPHAFVAGNPARQRGWVCVCGQRLVPCTGSGAQARVPAHRTGDGDLTCPDCGLLYQPDPASGGLVKA